VGREEAIGRDHMADRIRIIFCDRVQEYTLSDDDGLWVSPSGWTRLTLKEMQDFIGYAMMMDDAIVIVKD
jgi:hypothetical protein